jgi:DNA-3-methyladenine glycosylase II
VRGRLVMERYEMILEKSKQYDGQFFTGVKTTGIYCLPSCSAKTPKRNNVEFFNHSIEAEAAGYRPCKKCFPNVYGVHWKDGKKDIEIVPKEEFSFEECLVYLNRSETECLHKVKNGKFYKLIKMEDWNVLLKIKIEASNLRVSFLNGIPPKWVRAQAAKYVWDLFDLQKNLGPFYEMAENDDILKMLVLRYKGLRIVKIHDLFECLCWAVIGQQINLKFAYTLKKRLVEQYGEKLVFEGEDYYLFPDPQEVSRLQVEDLKQLHFTTKKAEYIIGIAQLLDEGTLRKEELALDTDYEIVKRRLVSIRGIGNWTADYTIMKCFNLNRAFPIADVGIHNALKEILGRDQKPSISEIQNLIKGWQGWEAYAAFYIWRWLYD